MIFTPNTLNEVGIIMPEGVNGANVTFLIE